jgi:hypothetical protein
MNAIHNIKMVEDKPLLKDIHARFIYIIPGNGNVLLVLLANIRLQAGERIEIQFAIDDDKTKFWCGIVTKQLPFISAYNTAVYINWPQILQDNMSYQ